MGKLISWFLGDATAQDYSNDEYIHDQDYHDINKLRLQNQEYDDTSTFKQKYFGTNVGEQDYIDDKYIHDKEYHDTHEQEYSYGMLNFDWLPSCVYIYSFIKFNDCEFYLFNLKILRKRLNP